MVVASQLADMRQLLAAERAALIDLLGTLDEGDWDLPTECSAWSVKGICLHLIGDDLSLLSRQRDGAPSGLRRLAADSPGTGFVELLNRFNESWVAAGSFMSPSVVKGLLRATGAWTSEFYDARALDELGEPVFWVGPDPAPYRLIVAREYCERWIHHMQIARAVGRPGAVEPSFLRAAVSGAARVLVNFVREALAERSSEAQLRVGTLGSWTFFADDSGRWNVVDDATDSCEVACEIGVDDAASAFSFGMSREQLDAAWRPIGSADAGRVLKDVLVSGLLRRR